MIDDIINQLDSMGVTYTEDYEAGTLTIHIGSVDKVQLIEIINMVNDTGLEFTIDEESINVTLPTEATTEPSTETTEPSEDMQSAALDMMYRK